MSFKSTATKEIALLLCLLLVGLLLVPIAIYVVGERIFGEYGGAGFMAFYGDLHGEIRAGDPVVWFLVLSPYLVWQLFRLTVWSFRRIGH